MLLSRQVQQSPAHKRKLAGYVGEHASAASSEGAGDADDILQAHARKRRLNDAFDALSLSQDSLLRHAVRQPASSTTHQHPSATAQAAHQAGRHAHAQTSNLTREEYGLAHAHASGVTGKRRASTHQMHNPTLRAEAEDVGMRDPSSFERDKHTIVITSLDDSDDEVEAAGGESNASYKVTSPHFAASCSGTASSAAAVSGSGGLSHDPEYAVDARHIPAFASGRLPFGSGGPVLPATPHVADGALVLYRGPASLQVAANLAQPLSHASFATHGVSGPSPGPSSGMVQAEPGSMWTDNEDHRHTAWDDQSSRFEELDEEYDDDSLDDILTGMSDADVDVAMELD